jgi:serine/threonine protein kinase
VDLALIGAGGMGKVFRAIDVHLGRAAAVKSAASLAASIGSRFGAWRTLAH